MNSFTRGEVPPPFSLAAVPRPQRSPSAGGFSTSATARVAPERADFRPVLPSLSKTGLSPEKRMAKLAYSEQLRHPNWQRKRLEALEAAGWQCWNCGDKETTLNVHHRRYVKGRMAWEYDLSELAVLCEPCHETEHKERELLNFILAQGGSTAIAIGLLAGYLDAGIDLDPGLAEMVKQADRMFYELGVAAYCLEAEVGRPGADDLPWRSIIRRHAANTKNLNPVLRWLIDEWDEQGKG